MPKRLYKWVHFSFWERWAIIFIALLALILYFWNQRFPTNVSPHFEMKLLSDTLSATLPTKGAVERSDLHRRLQDRKDLQLKLSPFDPNQISVDSLLKMGIPQKLAFTIDHFRSKGGQFRNPDDLQKIYGMAPTIFKQLEPFIQLGIRNNIKMQPTNYFYHKPRETLFQIIDVNKADSLAWESLTGIGPALASRILRFRKRLGGFYKVEQVGEIYGLADSVYQRIVPHLSVAPSSLQKISVNAATWDELRLHPYIGGRMASVIIKYRKQHGKFNDIEDLNALLSITTEQIEKLRPYLIFE